MLVRKWKIICISTGKCWLCNFRSETRAQYRIDNAHDGVNVADLRIVPQNF